MKTTMQNILGINTIFSSINYKGFTHDEFRSATSFMDYDAILIDSSYLAQNYGEDYPSTFEGKRMISKNESRLMIEEFARTKEQIIEFLKQGKNVFVLMATNENCFVHTGKTEYSGTGKNARGTNIVTEFNTFSFLPIDLKLTLVSGEKFDITCQSPYSTFFQVTKDMSYYDAYFEVSKKSSLLTIPNSNKSVSAVFEYEKGKIIILPYPYDEGCYETEKEWKREAKKYLDALLELNKALISNADTYSLPIWSGNIKILDEEDEENKLAQDLKKLHNMEQKIRKHEVLLNKIRQKKILITASGTPLEEIVQETLLEIGFKLSKTEKGRSDIIATYNDINIVAEIKGVTKSAAEKHAAQLEKWVAQFIEENEQTPKAILIVNGYCDTPLVERTEDVFPNQMLKYCEARGHVLITTTQLLCLYIEIKQNPNCADARITELLSSVGKYNRYLDHENYFKVIQKEENEFNE